MALSIASVMAPALLQLTGVVPSSYIFEQGKIVIVPRLLELPSHLTPALLTAGALLTVVLANIGFAQVVQALSASEREALTQAHRLRQLVPTRASLAPPSRRSIAPPSRR